MRTQLFAQSDMLRPEPVSVRAMSGESADGTDHPLLTPFALKGVTLRNRIVLTAHVAGLARDGLPQELYIAYQEERAKGGLGLTIVGASTGVTIDAAGGSGVGAVEAWRDEVIPWYRRLADAIHAHGTAVFTQLTHMGRRFAWDYQHWVAPVAPSPIREPAFRAFPRSMERPDFDRIVAGFADAARRVKAGGLDGLEVSAAHGHLLEQFCSPLSNQRTDRYGGTLRNRVRFLLEVLEGVRETVGPAFVVGVRMPADELKTGGLDRHACLEIASILAEEASIDFFDIVAGLPNTLPDHTNMYPDMEAEPAPFLELARSIRTSIGLPVLHAQGMTLDAAARAVADGAVDLVGMTRASLADAHLVRKLEEGRADDIRPCVRANYCIDRSYAGKQVLCLHNPATGRELTVPHRIAVSGGARKRIIVVGAGPAGLEAARVAARRGHGVVLFEQREHVGGTVAIAARAPGRRQLAGVTAWLEAQVRKTAADLRLECEATAGAIRAERPDVVVLATGGRPNVGPFAGHEHALTCTAVLDGAPLAPGHALVFDDRGDECALTTAAYLIELGHPVEFVTADPAPGFELERTIRPTLLRRLYSNGVVFVTDSRLVEIRRGERVLTAVLENEYTGRRERREVANVVVEYGSLPRADLYEALRSEATNRGELDLAAFTALRPQPPGSASGRFALYRIGDALTSRNIHAAIFDARRLSVPL